MDKILKEKITQHYMPEYKFVYAEKNHGIYNSLRKHPLLTGAGALITLPLLKGIAIPVLAFGGLYMGVTSMVVNSGARQEIEKDLRNGTLVDRYNKEVIQPRLEKTAETLRRLETEKEISESFTQTAEKPSPAVHNKKEPPKPGPRLEL